MAADTRPYKSKEQDGQGNELIIRDQQLVEQASQTTMASGEYFEIVDVDGRMAKIPKANMVDIVREALGSLLNGLSDQTTVTKVPSLNGNTLGASTVATLASVLGGGTRGVFKNIVGDFTGDLDSVSNGTVCVYNGSNVTNGIQGASYYVVAAFGDNNRGYTFQIAVTMNGNELYFRETLHANSQWIKVA